MINDRDGLIKDAAILFAEWVEEQRYSRTTNGGWRKTREIKEVEKTSEELYQIYLKSI